MKSAGRERRTWVVAVLLSGIVAVAGCRDSASGGPDDPTVSELPTTTAPPTTLPATTTTSLFPLDQDPPVIDLAYAQRILDEISRLDYEASLILYREKRVTPEHEAIMNAIYFGQALADARQGTATDLSVGLTTWNDPPRPTVRAAKRLLSSRPGCIALIADSDSRPRYVRPVSLLHGIGVVLERNSEPTADDRRINPSLWLTTEAGTIAPGKDISEICR
jgi:hypothetical protein